MTEPDDVLLGRAEIERAFTALGERLVRRGVVRTRDIDDLRLLAGIIGVDSAGTALRICADFYPDEPVSPRSAAVLQELFG